MFSLVPWAGFFYNNLSFARIRPAVRQMLRQQKDLGRGI